MRRRSLQPPPAPSHPELGPTTLPSDAPRLADAALLDCFRLLTGAAARRRARLAGQRPDAGRTADTA